jgi:hypothetical protein
VTRILSLNVNHRTVAKPLPPALTRALLDLAPDVLVLVEYVEGDGRHEFRAALAEAGLPHAEVTAAINFRGPRSWWNQVFVASRWPITVTSTPSGLNDCNASSFLSLQTGSIAMTGMRMPFWETAAEWYGAWEALVPRFQGGLLMGDMNIDPDESRKRHREPLRVLQQHGWRWHPAEGEWSYRRTGAEHVRSRVDHVFVRSEVEVTSARYVAEGIVGVGPVDHAALVVEVAAALTPSAGRDAGGGGLRAQGGVGASGGRVASRGDPGAPAASAVIPWTNPAQRAIRPPSWRASLRSSGRPSCPSSWLASPWS